MQASIIAENDEFEVLVLEVDELWSFVGNKKNDQWLWIVMHAETRQILAFHVGNRTKASGEALMAKLPIDLKKKHTFIQINSQLILKLSLRNNIYLLAKDPEKQVILKDLTVRSGKDAQD